MAIKTTRWRPKDTCDCVIEYEWDDTTSNDTRVHTFKNIIKCNAHSILADQDAYTHASEQNRRKNITLSEALDRFIALQETDTDGNIVLKKGISFNYSWSGSGDSRVLTISFTGVNLTTPQKNTLQTALNTRFGVGKVIVT